MPDRALLDTNVLVYALYEQSQHHQASRALIARAQASDAGFCMAAQSLAEFYAVVTNPRRVTPAKDYAAALEAIEAFLSLPGIALLHTPADVFSRWAELVRQHPVSGHRIFDLQLMATMLGNGVRRIFTFNASDFAIFSGIEVIVPK